MCPRQRFPVAAVLAAALLTGTSISAQAIPGPRLAPGTVEDGSMLLTVFLKHDQSRPLSKLNEQLKEQGLECLTKLRRGRDEARQDAPQGRARRATWVVAQGT
jgi:hypothetical protein